MNSVQLIGRLTRDPEIRYGAQSQTAVARFTVAIDRGKDRDGGDRGADFPSIVCFSKTAELVDKYVHKGDRIGITGRIQTGSYENSDGQKIYTTDVIADRIEFLSSKSEAAPQPAPAAQKGSEEQMDIYGSFSKLTDEDIPF